MNVNLAKWKRWAREFLPPDPLGGMQSGYARQFHPDQALVVYLGGILVAGLKFSIPEARRILGDLHVFMKANGFFFDAKGRAKRSGSGDRTFSPTRIAIRQYPDGLFHYTAQTRVSKETVAEDGGTVVKARYMEKDIGSVVSPTEGQARGFVCARVLDITEALKVFSRTLAIDTNHYRALP